MNNLENIACLFPQTLDEIRRLKGTYGADLVCLAGGTDLLVQWQTGGLTPPEQAVSLAGIPELCRISRVDDRIHVGAAVTHAALRQDPLIREHLPALAAAAATVGSRQIQARGTIGGNVANASPAGDLAPALLITDGAVVLDGPKGERKVKLTSFFLGYRQIDLHQDEFISRFELPIIGEGQRGMFRKLGPRKAQAISKIMGACRWSMTDGRVNSFACALGSVAPTAIRLREVEAWLTGQVLSAEILTELEKRVSESVAPIDDIRSTAAYRKWVAGRLARGFLAN